MKKTVRIAAVLLGIVLAALAALPFLIDANTWRPTLESTLTQSLGREVKLGDLKLAVFSGSVEAKDLSIAENPAFGKTPFVQAKALRVGVELWPLIVSRKLNVTGIVIDQPEIRLLQSASGEWNFSNLGSKAGGRSKPAEPASSGQNLDLSVKLFQIKDGRFAFGKLLLDAVNVQVRDFSAAAAFPFTFACRVGTRGVIELDGKVGPIAKDNVETTPVTAALKVASFDMAHALDGMGGVGAFDGSAESNGRAVQIKGKLKAEKLRFGKGSKPADRPVEFAFAVDHNLKTHAGRIAQGDIRIGAAAAALTGSYTESAVRLRLLGPDMPVQELAAMLPAVGVVLPAGSSLEGGSASVKAEMEGPSAALVTTGAVDIKRTTLKGFDLGRKMTVIQALAGIKSGPATEIETLSAAFRMASDGVRAETLRLVVPTIGELSGGGTVDTANTLDFKMTALVHTSGLMAAVKDAPIPFTVTGPASDPVFRPDVKSVVSEKAKSIGSKAAQGLFNRFLGGKKN